jgi:hypothetical protein
MTTDRPSNGLIRLLLPAAAIAAAVLAVFVVLDRMALDQNAADRRALAERSEILNASALVPGTALACLDGVAGDAAESACEAAVFASPQSTAAAVAYMSARLTLLADAEARDPALAQRLAASRRAIERDRFGIAAHVLSARDGCTASACPAFALVQEAGVLKANLKAQVFNQYVSRHAQAWNTLAHAPRAEPPAAGGLPDNPGRSPALSDAAPGVAPATETASAEPPHRPVPSKYDFPSADSIPPVSIMNAEPALPKAAAQAQARAQAKANAEAQAEGLPAQAGAEARPSGAVPVPPRRPQLLRDQTDTAAPR